MGAVMTMIIWKPYAMPVMRRSTQAKDGGDVARGRPPLPTAVKEAQGTLEKSRVNNNEARFDVPEVFPKPPLTLNSSGKKLWKELGPRLKEAGLYSEGDYTALELLCAAYGDWIAARKEIKITGMVIYTDTGSAYQHPLVGIANTNWKMIKEMLAQFGLTPAERTRVKALSPSERASSLAETLFAKARDRVEEGKE